MVQRFYKFIVAFCLALSGPAVAAQDLFKKIPVVTISARVPLIRFSVNPDRQAAPAFTRLGQISGLGLHQSLLHAQTCTIDEVNERISGQGPQVLKNRAVAAGISSSFYTDNFGIVCKKELQLEKSTRVPLRFRLGSLEYSNYLERERRGNR